MCFHPVNNNFVFNDYITVTKLEDKKILEKIGKKASDNIYVLNVNINDNNIFSDENKEIEAYYSDESGKVPQHLQITKKKYEEDKKNNKYTYLRDGRIDSKQYGTVIYYIESGKLCIYCKNVIDKLFKKESDKKTNFYYRSFNGSTNISANYDTFNYIYDSNKIIGSDQQLSPLVYVECPLRDKLVLTFYKKKVN